MAIATGRQRARLSRLRVVLVLLGAFLTIGIGLWLVGRLGLWVRHVSDAELLRELQEAVLPEPEPPPDADWPQWRGPHRDGISHEKGLRTEWPRQGPPKLWEAATGTGYSSAAVAAGRVYTLIQDDADETVVCWDADTGKELWRFGYPTHFHNQYPGTRSTPTVADGFVYVAGATGIVHCLDAQTGTAVWRQDLQKDLQGRVPGWGYSFSPLVEGDLVLTMPGGPDGNSLAAFHKRTGELVWMSGDDPAGYSSPVAHTFAGSRQILFFTARGLVGVSPADGRELWRFPWQTDYDCNIATPIAVGDYVFISSNYNRGCAVIKVSRRPGGAWDARRVYENNRLRNHFSSSVLYREHIYGFDESHTLVCLHLRTGEVVWKEKGFGKGTLLAADGHLIVLGENGQLAVAEATPAGFRAKSTWRFSGRRPWSAPALAGGKLYVRDDEKLVCLDVRKP